MRVLVLNFLAWKYEGDAILNLGRMERESRFNRERKGML